MKRAWFGWVAGFLLLLSVLSIPVFVWALQPSHLLNVAILDKTVPDTTFREHKGLMWLLNHMKYVKHDKTAYTVEKDYYGYVPEPEGHSIRELDLSNDYDLLYIADTYGVYKDDISGVIEHGNRSNKIYGGLQASDIDQVKNALFKGTTLIAEFNTFGSPTDPEAKKALYEILGLRWSGWIGRFFPELSGGGELPEWAKSNYEHQTGTKWSFAGPGFVFVSEQDQIIVLEEGKDTGKSGNVFRLTEEGEAFVGSSLKARYNYWFDVIEPEDSKEVLAYYQLDVTDAGEDKLREQGLPSTFPAVIRHDTGIYRAYYFAGDYADNNEVPGFYKASWLDSIFRAVSWDSGKSEQSFYWRAYLPLMKRIFKEATDLREQPNVPKENTFPVTADGITIPAKVGGQYLQLYKDNRWNDFLIKGVNLGIGKPGHFPGEAAISKAEYMRWFKYIGEMKANVIRNYTLHPPAFYEALLEYNLKAEEPIYLLHGVWVNEEKLVSLQDAYAAELSDEYKKEIQLTVDVIHGNASLPAKPGHASGVYRADISKYVLGWVLGIEWDPEVVVGTNEKHRDIGDFNGRYFQTEKASPFEAWLAGTMDEVVAYETDKYHWQRPVSFTNWTTTDLLNHPSEPLSKEDMVSVDPNVINQKPSFQAGYFASYHTYPYYPDFMNYETKYTDYVDFRGVKNSYSGYLHDLKQAHRMPVLIAEFGVPSSRGMTHRNVHGWNQGKHNEQEQGNIAAGLFEDIYHEGMAGGIVFTWQDEWFKRTWNTMDLDNPDRRPFWANTQTSEQSFGLLTFDPSEPKAAIYEDGDVSDWTRAGISPVAMKPAVPVKVLDSNDKQREIKQLFVTSDAGYVHFRIDFGENGGPLDWSKTGAMILLDTIPGQGQYRIPGGSGLTTDAGIDFVIDLKGPKESRIWVDSYYDSTYYQYGHQLKFMPFLDYASKKDNGVFHKMKLVLNRPLTIPNVRGQTLELPLETYETGFLRYGNANPKSPDFDSMTDVAYHENGHVVEVRIPWQLLNVKDPSHRQIMGDLWEKGLQGSEQVDHLKMAVLSYRPLSQGSSDTPGSPDIAYSLPGISQGQLKAEDMYRYQWEKWETPKYQERLKKSYYIMKQLYEKVALSK
ncbi:hypothetical protein RAC89_06620 [Paenibacillus sp. GD4]|jgi:hypothetical protein|uniref:hypothetical protein n=1 Tax=Paenibacillus sp. GD4 TaxID=3068890 RepID=UPI002796E1B3|nr:hypothetical protein [Paenibacillus sp. GD4]MDQ1910171.1 hypothetical protein [Paenibacillus sp. GD4]